MQVSTVVSSHKGCMACSHLGSQLVLCYQDQWDIYKLDPLYECFIPASPAIPFIIKWPQLRDQTLRTSSAQSSPNAQRPDPTPFHGMHQPARATVKDVRSSTMHRAGRALSLMSQGLHQLRRKTKVRFLNESPICGLMESQFIRG